MIRLFRFLLLLLPAVPACTHTLDHEISVTLDLPTECLTFFPECSPDGDFKCVDVEGRVYSQCRVACVAGRSIMCAEDGPECFQRAGTSDFQVPAVCLDRNLP